jgi:cytochrome c-type biogenesis protein CcmE
VLKWKHALVAPNVMRSEDRQMNQQKERLGGLVIPGSLPRRNPLTRPTEPLIR